MDSWYIGNVKIENRVVSAPLAGISNPAFRVLLKEFNPGLIYTEMTSDKALIYKNKKTMKMLEVKEKERPVSLQLFGNNPDEMAKAAVIVQQNSLCDIIDINMGCPMVKVVRQGSGSALLQNPDNAYNIVKAVKEVSKLPVTIKMRVGWDLEHINAIEFAQLMEKAGADCIAVHGRTRSQLYNGASNWEIIKQVKESVNIPVIGNGDINDVYTAKKRLEESGVDAIMIGRGMLGNPWLITDTVQYLQDGSRIEEPTIHERFIIERKQAKAFIQDYGENQGMRMMRSHACWYIQGLSHNKPVKDRVCRITTYKELDDILTAYEEALGSGDFSFLKKED